MNTLTALEKVGAYKDAIFVQEISAIIIIRGLRDKALGLGVKMQTFLKNFHLRGVGKVSEQRLHNTWGFLYLPGPLKDSFPLFSCAWSPRPLLLCCRGPSYHHNRQSNLVSSVWC